jgi:hypothetical protein
MKDVFDKYYRMGTLTIARSRSGDGWVVMENGEQVGGTLLHPFESEAAAQRWVDEEKADYQEGLLCGDYEQLARAKVIRQTDAELWARFADIEEQFDRDDDERAAPGSSASDWRWPSSKSAAIFTVLANTGKGARCSVTRCIPAGDHTGSPERSAAAPAGRRDRFSRSIRSRSSFAPPTCRMPLGPSQASPELIPEEGSSPGFDIA